jgi:hypothetical protein
MISLSTVAVAYAQTIAGTWQGTPCLLAKARALCLAARGASPDS